MKTRSHRPHERGLTVEFILGGANGIDAGVMHEAALLILDDDRRFAETASSFAREVGFTPHAVATLGEAIDAASRIRFDCALVDIGLPDGCGLELLAEPRLAAARKIVMSGDVSLVSWAGRRVPGTIGALAKPFRFAAFRELLARQNGPAAGATVPSSGLIGASSIMRATVDELLTVAPTRFPVLIHGESGTGKELAAQALHAASGRPGRFVAVNCATLSPDLMSSQLFGHRRGSFTGAVDDEAGLVAQAEGGTLFLDELAEAPGAVQAGLLRFLESGELRPLGGRVSRKADVRVVAATNLDPQTAISTGLIRADLYYRIAGYEIRMPALRERPDDLEAIAQAILDELNREYGTCRRLAAGWQEHARGYQWPGNVRELRQRLRRAWIGGIDPIGIEVPAIARPAQRTLDDIERDAISAALAASGGDRAVAAAQLGISERTIYNRLARYRSTC